MAKKMNNYVKFPLILGLTCLVCGGALAGINYLTRPYIQANEDKKAGQALDNIIGKDNYSSVETVEASIESANIVEVKKVTLNSGKIAYYYQLKSDKGYSGTVTFGTAFDENGVMGYSFISGDEDDLGLQVAMKNDKWNEALATYDPSAGGNINFTGGSAAATIPAIKAAIDTAYADYMAKQGIVVDTSLIKITGGCTRVYNNRWYYTLTATNTKNGYGALKLDIVVDIAKNAVTSVKVSDYLGATEGYGQDLLKTGVSDKLIKDAAEKFYNTYVNCPSSGLPFDLFIGDQAADVQRNDLEGANAIFQTGASYTARSWYALIQKAITMAQAEDWGSFTDVKTEGYLDKESSSGSDKVYVIKSTNDNSGYGSLVLKVTLDPAASKVKDVKVEKYVDTTYGFGYALLNGLDSAKVNDKGDTFYDTYVKIPTDGLDFAIFKEKDPNKPGDDSFFKTGATYTAKAYYAAISKAIDMAEKNEEGAEFAVPENSYSINVTKQSEGVYKGILTNSLDKSHYSTVDATITLDTANSKVTKIELDVSKIGTGGYGEILFDGKTNDNLNSEAATKFYNTYVKMPSGGFDFDLFLNYDPQMLPPLSDESADIANTTGATYSANNYIALVNYVILYALGGN